MPAAHLMLNAAVFHLPAKQKKKKESAQRIKRSTYWIFFWSLIVATLAALAACEAHGGLLGSEQRVQSRSQETGCEKQSLQEHRFMFVTSSRNIEFIEIVSRLYVKRGISVF